MRLYCYLGGALLLAGGVFAGSQIRNAASFDQGQLAACGEIVKIFPNINPLFQLVKTECAVCKGEVGLRVNGACYSLDGSRKLSD